MPTAVEGIGLKAIIAIKDPDVNEGGTINFARVFRVLDDIKADPPSELAGKGFGQDLQDFMLNFAKPTDQHLGGLLLPAVNHLLPAVQHDDTVGLLGVAPPDDHGLF
jgi:hypothetical protein